VHQYTFPATENFTVGNVGSPGTLVTGWSDLSGYDLNWFVDNNGTPTADTGPIDHHTSNNTSGKCMYVVCTGATATPTNVAILKSNCYTVHPDQPCLTFWYSMRGTQMGSLFRDVNVGGVVTLGVWSVTGDQGLNWKQGWLDLAPYFGQADVRFRFRAVTGSGEHSNMAFDDVVVKSMVAVLGCPDVNASNYNSAVIINDGCCSYACSVGFERVTLNIIRNNMVSRVFAAINRKEPCLDLHKYAA